MGERRKLKGKADKLVDWLKGWDGFDSYLKFNALVRTEGDASVNVVVNSTPIEKFIDGTAIYDFTFRVNMMFAWSDGFDSTNTEAFNTMSSLLDWIDEQYPDNTPDWDGAEIMDITVTDSAPSLDYVEASDEMAQYSIVAKIRYKE